MSSNIRYGHVAGEGRGREYRVAADQYVSRKGGKFVQLVAGYSTLCATGGTQIMGWMETPKDAEGYNAWKSSATAGTEKLFVIEAGGNVFELPVDEKNASITATYIGAGAGIVNSGTTYTLIQKAKLGAVTASPLTIVDFDKTNHTVRVKVKAKAIQSIG
jgi:hypothetical protein